MYAVTCRRFPTFPAVLITLAALLLPPACASRSGLVELVSDPSSALDGLPESPPAGIDGEVWDELTSGLAESLQALGTARNVRSVPQNVANRVRDLVVEDDGGGGVNLTWTYRNVGDYDFNSEVNAADLVPIGMHFGVTDDSPNWFEEGVADGDENGEVNVADLVPIGANFHHTVNGYVVEKSTTPDDPESWVEVGQVPLSEGKFTSDVAVKQVLITTQIVDVKVDETISVRPFAIIDAVPELGIRSYDDGSIVEDSQLWTQVGGGAGHAGNVNVLIPALSQVNRSRILASPRLMTINSEADADFNSYRGGPDGFVRKYNDLDELQWETKLNWPVNFLYLVETDSTPWLFTFHGQGYSLLDPDTGSIDQTEQIGAVTAEPLEEDPFGDDWRLTFGSRQGIAQSINLKLSINPEWYAQFDGEITSDPLRVGARYMFKTEDIFGGMDRIVSVDATTGQDQQVVDQADSIRGALRWGQNNTFWANLQGLKLQRYEADGSKGEAITPNDGEINDFDTFENKIAVAVRTGLGGHKAWKWDLGLQTITGEHVHDSPVRKIAMDGNGIASFEEDGDLNIFDPGVVLQINVPTNFSRIPFIKLDLDRVTLNDGMYLEVRDRSSGDLLVSRGMVDQGQRLQVVGNRDIICGPGAGWQTSTFLDTGSTVVIGGLIRGGEPVQTGPPALSKIPIIGHLFSSKAASSYKESLIVTITPRIIEAVDPVRPVSALGDSGLALIDVITEEVDWDVTFDDPEVSAPVYVPGTYYVVSNDPGANSGTLHAVDETLGTISWDASLGAPGVTVPTVSATGWVFVADADGGIHAFSGGGDEQWVQSYPGISTGLVAGGSNDLYFATAEGTVYGLDGATGGLDWSAAAPGPIEGSTPSLASGGRLRLGTLSGELVEIDPYDATPSALVLYTGDSAIVTQPASGSGGKTVFADLSGRAVCLDSGGVVQWTYATGVAGRIEVSLAPSGNVYLSTAWGELIELGT